MWFTKMALRLHAFNALMRTMTFNGGVYLRESEVVVAAPL